MKKIFLILTVWLFLSACWGGYSPDSTFYRLNSLSDNKEVFEAKHSVVVADVGLPEYLNRPQMVMMDDNSPEVQIAEFHRWGEDLPKMMQRKVVADLSKYLPNSQIVDTQEEVQNAKYNVKIEVVRLDMVKQGYVIFEANWYITDRREKMIKKNKFLQQQKIKVNYGDYAATAAKLLGDMTRNIAEDLDNI